MSRPLVRKAATRPAGRARQAGYTLIELVMVLMVLTVGIPPLISLGSNCVQKMHQGAYVTTAVSLAQEKLEMVLGDRSIPSRGWTYIIAANYPSEASISGFPGFTRSVTIAADSTYNTITYRNVSVTVTAPDNTQLTLFTWVVH